MFREGFEFLKAKKKNSEHLFFRHTVVDLEKLVLLLPNVFVFGVRVHCDFAARGGRKKNVIINGVLFDFKNYFPSKHTLWSA